eukprot:GFUD01000554.1.p1 GENE.GFUD01000554.1~~GFUD01000554.1.p1  ORF type:complete len:469 (+),score=176.08 GFUD01000554.1:949-2355(+)
MKQENEEKVRKEKKIMEDNRKNTMILFGFGLIALVLAVSVTWKQDEHRLDQMKLKELKWIEESKLKTIEAQTKIQEMELKIRNRQLENEEKFKLMQRGKERIEQEKNEMMMQTREKRKDEEQSLEQNRITKIKQSLKEEFSHWITKEVTDQNRVIANMKNVKEFHRCKAIENIDKETFKEVVINIAKILHLSEEQAEEIQLAAKADTMVNVLEDFEHGHTGLYSYGKYQTLRHANGNLDLVIALHTLTYHIDDKTKIENNEDTEAQMGIPTNNVITSNEKETYSVITSSEREQYKSLFRGQAMKLFENDCPNKLLTDINIATQAEFRNKARDGKIKEEEKENKDRIEREEKQIQDEKERIERKKQEIEANQEKREKDILEHEKKKIEEIEHAEKLLEEKEKKKMEEMKNEIEKFERMKQKNVEEQKEKMEEEKIEKEEGGSLIWGQGLNLFFFFVGLSFFLLDKYRKK